MAKSVVLVCERRVEHALLNGQIMRFIRERRIEAARLDSRLSGFTS